MLEVTLLGTGGTRLTAKRYLTSAYVRDEINGVNMLIDCGEGTQRAIEKAKLQISAIDILFLTHQHGDHTYGLPGLIQSMSLAERVDPLFIVAPTFEILQAVKKVIEIQTCSFNLVLLTMNQPNRSYKLPSNRGSITVGNFEVTYKNVTVKAISLRHSVPTYGYVFDMHRLAKFDKEKALANNIPVKYWNALQHGNSVIDQEGRELTPQMVLNGTNRKGIKFVYATDQAPCKGLVCNEVKNADLYIIECMYISDEDLAKAKLKRHLMIGEAVEVFKRTTPSKMVLTHFGTKVTDGELSFKLKQFVGDSEDIKAGKQGQVFRLGFTD